MLVLLILVLLIFVKYYVKVNIFSKLNIKNKPIEMKEIEGDFKDSKLILDNKKWKNSLLNLLSKKNIIIYKIWEIFIWNYQFIY